MKGLIKRGRKWHIDTVINGQRVCRSTGTEDRELALNILAKIRTEIIERRYYPKPPGENKLFCECLARFVKEHSRRVSEKTRQSYACSLKNLLPVFSEMPLNQITSKRLYQYQEDRLNEGAAPASVNREIALVSVAFSTAVKKWGWIDNNPCTRIERLPENNERVRYLVEGEVEKLYSVLPEWLKPIVTVARFTGLRLSNVVGYLVPSRSFPEGHRCGEDEERGTAWPPHGGDGF